MAPQAPPWAGSWGEPSALSQGAAWPRAQAVHTLPHLLLAAASGLRLHPLVQGGPLGQCGAQRAACSGPRLLLPPTRSSIGRERHRKRGRRSQGAGTGGEAFPTKMPWDVPTSGPACTHSHGGGSAHPPHTGAGLRASLPSGGRGPGGLRVPPSPSLSLSPRQGLAAFRDKGPLRPQTQPGEGTQAAGAILGSSDPNPEPSPAQAGWALRRLRGSFKPGVSPRRSGLTHGACDCTHVYAHPVFYVSHTHARTHPGCLTHAPSFNSLFLVHTTQMTRVRAHTLRFWTSPLSVLLWP